MKRALSSIGGWVGRHRDLAVVVAITTVAVMIRAAFLFRAPVFVTGDSESYLGPAYDLARVGGFDLSLKRTPGYPVFVAAVIATAGEDLRAVAFIQHVLGVGSAALTAILARMCFGPLAGAVAGLVMAVNGAFLLAEHSIMTEGLFVPLITAWTTATVIAMRRRRWPLYVLSGLLLGAAVLVRPVAQALIPLIPIAILVVERRLGRTLRYSAVALAAYAAIAIPWSLRTAADRDSAAIGSLGQTLVGRIARHDRGGFVCYRPDVDTVDPDPVRSRVRQVVQEAVDRGSSGKAINTRLRKELNLSAADADRLMRDIALECIRRQPGYYVQGSLQRAIRLSFGSVERLAAYRNTSDVARREWEDEDTRRLLAPATAAEERAVSTAAWLVGLYQPGYLGPILPVLALVGTVVSMFKARHHAAFVVGASSFGLLLISAFLVGNVARYRFPSDPGLAIMAVGGAVTIVRIARDRFTSRGTDARPG